MSEVARKRQTETRRERELLPWKGHASLSLRGAGGGPIAVAREAAAPLHTPPAERRGERGEERRKNRRGRERRGRKELYFLPLLPWTAESFW